MGLWDAIKFWDDKREKRTEVHVRVHLGFLHEEGGRPHYFVTVWNASPEREVTITHTWFATEPRADFSNKFRPLPARIAPRSQWETWIPADFVSAEPPGVFTLARVQLADGRVIESSERKDVPPAGSIPGR